MMKIVTPRIFWGTCLVSVLSAGSAFAAGFDCAKAKTAVEKMVCADPVLSQLDTDLKAVFDEAQSEASGIDGNTGKRIDPVGQEERDWLQNVRNKCRDAICLKAAYTKRIQQIRQDWLAPSEAMTADNPGWDSDGNIYGATADAWKNYKLYGIDEMQKVVEYCYNHQPNLSLTSAVERCLALDMAMLSINLSEAQVGNILPSPYFSQEAVKGRVFRVWEQVTADHDQTFTAEYAGRMAKTVLADILIVQTH